MNAIADDVVPSFCWDRNLTVGQIRLFTTKPDMDWHILDNEVRAIAALLSRILSRLRIERIPDYVLDPLSVRDLGAFVDSLRRMFAEMAYPK